MTPTPDSSSGSTRSSGRRFWSDTVPRWAIIGLFLFALVLVLSYAEEFFVPIVLAFLLAMVFSPIRRFVDRRGVPSGLTSLVIVLGLLLGFVALLGALSLPVTNAIENAPQIERQIQEKLGAVSGTLQGLFEANDRLEEIMTSNSPDVQKVEVQGAGLAASAALLAPSVITQFVFTLVMLLFLLASGDMFYEKLVHVMPTFHDKRRAVRIAKDIERKLSRYLLTITIINAGLGIAIGIAMWLLGMPSPLVFGVIGFIFNFIPYLGAIAGVAIAGSVALLAFDWIGWAPIVAATYFGLTAIEGQFITPYMVGRSLKLNTVVVFVAVSFWAWLWSAVGMIVAVPLLVAFRTFCEHIPSLEPLGDFLSERHAELQDETTASEAG